jgi:hypothetical protein
LLCYQTPLARLALDNILLDDITIEHCICSSSLIKRGRYPRHSSKKERERSAGIAFSQIEACPSQGVLCRHQKSPPDHPQALRIQSFCRHMDLPISSMDVASNSIPGNRGDPILRRRNVRFAGHGQTK